MPIVTYESFFLDTINLMAGVWLEIAFKYRLLDIQYMNINNLLKSVGFLLDEVGRD
jgi:hypothetical protein